MHHVGKFYTVDSADVNKIDPFQESLRKEFYAEVFFLTSSKNYLFSNHFVFY